ncbi:hypothetical protein Clacol_008430 [Clathrus columnatus]|uniref:Uncharacterized protein n=1 Tax=Clathrus columnatus TaxID=1419009 RepID=A0AAV5AN83_9AGAM|nr:hypothetical protein Clacol_008430 [Clathrus columnatus]
MVHFPPDSRLLASLVKQEQAYSSQLYSLLNASSSSLSALVIYASSSPTEISHTLKNVANALSGADDAFRNYGEAINNWIDQLRSISRKEEEIANIGRQREMLVTRLIKVSQKSKASPQSLLHSASDSTSNVSFKSFNSKVSAAQMELQACESHLAAQERELETFRLSALKQALRLRCQALVQCAWTWGELGRRCLSFIDGLNNIPLTNGASASGLPLPLSNGIHDHDHDHDSALSSLAPSQSASQIGANYDHSPHNLYSLKIPPPHLVPENGTIPVPSPIRQQNLAGQQQEVGSSSESEEQVEIHDNPRYKQGSLLGKVRGNTHIEPASPQGSPSRRFMSSNSDVNSLPLNLKDRRNSGFFNGLASLFKSSMVGGKSSQSGGWDTRTDRNIRGVRTDVDESSDEDRRNSRKLNKIRSKTGHLSVPHSPLLNGSTQLSLPSPANSQQPRIRKKSLSRAGTVRSSISEPPTPRRERALTLTAATGQRQSLHIPSERRLSSDDKPRPSVAEIKRLSHHGTLLKHSSPHKVDGLMRIVEGISLSDDPLSLSETSATPPPMGPSILLNGSNSGITSVHSSPTAAHVNFPTRSTSSERKPLKSALRNPSRERDRSVSPLSTGSSSGLSPDKRSTSVPMPQAPSVPSKSLDVRPSPKFGPAQQSTDVATLQTSINERPSSPRPSISDTASISSYETGRESFDEDEERTNLYDFSSIPILPSQSYPTDPASQIPVRSDIHEIGSVTSDDTTIANGSGSGTMTVRRKSVRMSSLPPEVHERTPTQEDYGEGDLFTANSGSNPQPRHDASWESRSAGDPSDVWEDSASEDEGYKEAKRALNRAKRHSSSIRK